MFLVKPAESLHERMHTITNTYNLLIPINISTRNMNLTICAPREACARQPCGSPDMLSRVRMHAWTCLMAQIINIYMRRLVPGAGAGPACLRGVAGLAGKCRFPALQRHACAHDSCMHMCPGGMHVIYGPIRGPSRPLTPSLYV